MGCVMKGNFWGRCIWLGRGYGVRKVLFGISYSFIAVKDTDVSLIILYTIAPVSFRAVIDMDRLPGYVG